MAVTKTEIFIASRFDEFSDLRNFLRAKIDSFPVFPLQAVDLNDNISSGAPPLGKCLAAVKRAEVMILLVGETYGGSPQGEELSYTHLEYRAAIDEKSPTVVLPFFIGPSYKYKLSEYSSDLKHAKWQKEIIENHTPAFYDGTIEIKELTQIIFDNILKTLYEVRDAEIRHQMDLLAASSGDDYISEDDDCAEELSLVLSQDELDKLDERTQTGEDHIFGEDVDEIRDVAELLKRPAEIAALEQKREALKAVALGDRFVAMQHFRKALEIRPMDIKAAYWLSRLLSTSGMNRDYREAVRLALHACKMGEYENRPMLVAASYMVASRVSAKLNAPEEALEYALKAVEAAPRLAIAHAELACQFANNNQVEQALIRVRQAFMIKPEIILLLNKDSFFMPYAREYGELKRQLRQELFRMVKQMLEAEKMALAPFVQASKDDESILADIDYALNKLQGRPLFNLLYDGRQIAKSFLRNLQSKCNTFSNACSNKIHTSPANQEKTAAENNASKFRAGAIISAVIGGAALLLGSKIFAAVSICLAIVFGIMFAVNSSKKDKIVKYLSSNHQEVRDSLVIVCDAIALYEKVIGSFIHVKWPSIKYARIGDVVRIDLKLQRDALQQFKVDDRMVPPEFDNYFDSAKYVDSARFRFYRVIEMENRAMGFQDGRFIFDDSNGG